MTEQPASVAARVGTCLLNNWVEERATAGLDTEETKTHIQRYGHKGILTMDQESKMETMTTLKAAHGVPKSPGVRLRGIRGELLEKHIAQMISEELQAERNPPIPKTDYCSTTQADFCVEGFVPSAPETTQISVGVYSQPVHDYKSDQAVSFWSENYRRVQGVTAAQTPRAPFRKSAKFSTPIGERLDEPELPADD